jgi:nucleotide-binding universal stress UspA family protein
MAITTLLAVHSIDAPIGSVNPVIELCGDIGAHLNLVVFGVMQTIPTATYGGMPDYYLTDEHDRIIREARERAAAVEKLIQEAYLSASVLVECVDAGMIGRTMSKHALYADVTIFPNGSIPEHEFSTDAFNGILFNSGQPVIVLGAGEKPLPTAKRVIMAWNGEPEAAKAVHRSLPLLQSAQDVHVVIIDPSGNSGANPGDDLAAFLTRHGLKVTVDQLPSAGKEVAEVLLQHAMDKDADLIVMGAYGHSRLREWLLGGTTRDLLTKAKLPVLMVH